jgi:hypothetical protein
MNQTNSLNGGNSIDNISKSMPNTNQLIANNNKEFNKIAQKVECSGKIPSARFGHIMVMVSPTKVVLFGGAVGDTRTFSITNETFCYNIMTKIWSKLVSK